MLLFGMDPTGPLQGAATGSITNMPLTSPEFTDLALQGCAMDPIENSPSSCSDVEPNAAHSDAPVMSSEDRMGMQRFRTDYMAYFYCYDRQRYPVPPFEWGFTGGKVASDTKMTTTSDLEVVAIGVTGGAGTDRAS